MQAIRMAMTANVATVPSPILPPSPPMSSLTDADDKTATLLARWDEMSKAFGADGIGNYSTPVSDSVAYSSLPPS